jgi:hypothetical protein
MRRWKVLLAVLVITGALGPAAEAIILARESVGFTSFVQDEALEVVHRQTLRRCVEEHVRSGLRGLERCGTRFAWNMDWVLEQRAQRVEERINAAWGAMVADIQATWARLVAGCMCNPQCIAAAYSRLLAELPRIQADYWRRVAEALAEIEALWWRGPRPDQGAVISAVFRPVPRGKPAFVERLGPDPYFHQLPPPPRGYPVRDPEGEPPGDPGKEEQKEQKLGRFTATVSEYQDYGYTVLFQVYGRRETVTVVALAGPFCPVPAVVPVERAVTDWPAVAEGYGIPRVCGYPRGMAGGRYPPFVVTPESCQ